MYLWSWSTKQQVPSNPRITFAKPNVSNKNTLPYFAKLIASQAKAQTNNSTAIDEKIGNNYL